MVFQASDKRKWKWNCQLSVGHTIVIIGTLLNINQIAAINLICAKPGLFFVWKMVSGLPLCIRPGI